MGETKLSIVSQDKKKAEAKFIDIAAAKEVLTDDGECAENGKNQRSTVINEFFICNLECLHYRCELAPDNLLQRSDANSTPATIRSIRRRRATVATITADSM